VINNILYVTSDNGHIYAYLLDSVAPSVASFTSEAEGLSVSFTAASPSNGSLYYYSWNFGDGSTSTGMTVNHTYAKAGAYTVMLFVANPAGDVASSVRSLAVDTTNSSSEIPMWAWIVLLVAVVAIIGLALFMMRRKK
jgi:PKD repeat protein